MDNRHIDQPPRWADRLLEWFVAPHLLEDVQGDLQEVFYKRVGQIGVARARREYGWAVLHYLTPFFYKRKPRNYPNPALTDMFRNYVKIAWRNLRQHKAFSAINILGLAIGMATCLLISLFVLDELSYDRFHAKGDRIYRINADLKVGDSEQQLAVVPDPFGPSFAKEFPQVEKQVRFRNYGGYLVNKGTESLKEEKVVFADSSLLDVFTLPMVAGNPKTVLTEPHSVVITESIARKYFGTIDVLGKTLTFNRMEQDKITGVIRDIPHNSHVQFDFFRSMLSADESKQGNWLSFNFNTYVLLREGIQQSDMDARMRSFTEKYASPALKKWANVDLKGFEKTGGHLRYSLMPLTAIHLHSDRVGELTPNSDIRYVYIFGALALFILLIACVNFTNLSTAQSAGRAKEVGMRKVLGSLQRHLVGQFLTESIVMSFFSMLVALGLTLLLLPFFNDIADKAIHLSPVSYPLLIPLLAVFALGVGLLAGSYPAFFLAAFQPIRVLKGNLKTGTKNSSLRSGLVVFQFSTSLLIIIGTIVIYTQLNYIRSKKIGFDKEQVLLIKDVNALENGVASFKEEVLRLPGVVNGTVTGFFPVDGWGLNSEAIFPEGTKEADKALKMEVWNVDQDYLATMGMNVVQGRNFSKQLLTDSSAVLINQAAARLLGYSNPLNRIVQQSRTPTQLDQYTIIGVVSNFHFQSLRQNVGPMILRLRKSEQGIGFKLHTSDVASVVAAIESTWKTRASGQPFTYAFLDESFDRMYRSEQRIGQIFITFAALSTLIACLGLFGLAAYTAEQRTKEIGVRKVLGASVISIVALLSKDFLKLVVLSIVFTTPIAWYAMSRWLQDFAYKIDLSWWMFALAGLMAVGIALLTVSYQSIKAALVNPVKSLRAE